MSYFSEYFDDQAKILIERIKKEHSNEDGHLKGTLAELSMKSLLEALIPSFCGVARGWIVDAIGNRTHERDIIIFNKNAAPAFMLDFTTGVIPAISVLYDIQIKSNIRANSIKGIIDKFIPVSDLAATNTLISYAGELGKNRLVLEVLADIDPAFYTNPTIHQIAVLNYGFYFFEHVSMPLKNVLPENDIKKGLKEFFSSKIETTENKSAFNEYLTNELSMNLDDAKKIIINSIDINQKLDEPIEIYSWYGIHCPCAPESSIRFYFAKLMNDLFSNSVGKYLLKESLQFNTFTRKIYYGGDEIYSNIEFKNGYVNEEFKYGFSINGTDFKVTCKSVRQ